MESNVVIVSVVTMTGLGVVFAVVLSIAYQRFKIQEDPRIGQIEKILPGANCGACGFSGCHGFAEELVGGGVGIVGCPAAGEELSQKIAAVLGKEAEKIQPQIAVVHCGAKACRRPPKKADYVGPLRCQAAHIVGGDIGCSYGCLDYGDCVRVCEFEAIKLVEDLPEVDGSRCTGCGRCVETCPRNIISLEVFGKDGLVAVACSSHEKGAVVKKICEVGCIACRICEKVTAGIFKVEDNLARVEYGKATDSTPWDEAISRCPTKCIVKIKSSE